MQSTAITPNQPLNLDYQALSQAVSQPKSQQDNEKQLQHMAAMMAAKEPAAAAPSMSSSDLLTEIQTPAKASSDTPIDETTKEPDYAAQPAAMEVPAQTGITEVAAKEKAKRWIQFRDLLQSRGFAYAAGNIDDYEKFQLKEWEINWLVDAYAAYMQELGYVPKWLDLVLAELTILSPRCFDAYKMRKLKKENDALKHKLLQMEAYNRVLREQQAGQHRQPQQPARTIALKPNHTPPAREPQQQVANGEFIQIHDTVTENITPQDNQPPAQQIYQHPAAPLVKQETPKVQGRADFKKYWLIDDNFYFINDTAGTYLPVDKRKDRCEINADTYQLLIKHNDKNKIDGLLNRD